MKRWPWLAGGAVVLLFLLTRKGSPPPSGPPLEVSAARKRFGSILDEAADRRGVPRALLRAVAWVESRWNPTAGSSVGAVGLLQLMPGTATSLGVKDRTDPAQNADGGAKFLASLRQKAGSWPVALAAYNWGPGNVFGAGSKPPHLYSAQWPANTQQYVREVLDAMERRVV